MAYRSTKAPKPRITTQPRTVTPRTPTPRMVTPSIPEPNIVTRSPHVNDSTGRVRGY